MSLSGGCQCGAVRFEVADGGLGKGSICHCRMCQKAFGGFFGPLITAQNSQLTWTRGAPAYFQSSNKVSRGFCQACGTPLTYVVEKDQTELAMGAFDDPAKVPPLSQLQTSTRVPFFDGLPTLPERDLTGLEGLVSYQHPDHDTDDWPRS